MQKEYIKSMKSGYKKKLFLLFSHSLTTPQIEDAKQILQVEEFLELPYKLQQLWSNVPSDIGSVKEYLRPLKQWIEKKSTSGDYILIQGDFGATYQMVNFSKSLNLVPIYATTKREVVEVVNNNEILKQSIFKHVRFRVYE